MHDYTGDKEVHATMLLQLKKKKKRKDLLSWDFWSVSQKNYLRTAHALSAMWKLPSYNSFLPDYGV